MLSFSASTLTHHYLVVKSHAELGCSNKQDRLQSNIEIIQAPEGR